jgi:hypothetical protein
VNISDTKVNHDHDARYSGKKVKKVGWVAPAPSRRSSGDGPPSHLNTTLTPRAGSEYLCLILIAEDTCQMILNMASISVEC